MQTPHRESRMKSYSICRRMAQRIACDRMGMSCIYTQAGSAGCVLRTYVMFGIWMQLYQSSPQTYIHASQSSDLLLHFIFYFVLFSLSRVIEIKIENVYELQWQMIMGIIRQICWEGRHRLCYAWCVSFSVLTWHKILCTRSFAPQRSCRRRTAVQPQPKPPTLPFS
jgi:hypothetical protein